MGARVCVMLCHGRGPQARGLSIPGSIPRWPGGTVRSQHSPPGHKQQAEPQSSQSPIQSRALVGQIHGVHEGLRHVRDLLAAEREIIERIPFDGESVPVSLQVMEIEILREDQLSNEL